LALRTEVEIVKLTSIDDTFFILIEVKIRMASNAKTLPVLQTPWFKFSTRSGRIKVESFVTLNTSVVILNLTVLNVEGRITEATYKFISCQAANTFSIDSIVLAVVYLQQTDSFKEEISSSTH